MKQGVPGTTHEAFFLILVAYDRLYQSTHRNRRDTIFTDSQSVRLRQIPARYQPQLPHIIPNSLLFQPETSRVQLETTDLSDK